MVCRNAGKKRWHFNFLTKRLPGCERSGEGRGTVLLLLLHHPPPRSVPFCSQQLYFDRQIKQDACCSEFSTSFREISDCCSADSGKLVLPVLQNSSEVESPHQGLPAWVQSQAKASDTPLPLPSLLVSSQLGGQVS